MQLYFSDSFVWLSIRSASNKQLFLQAEKKGKKQSQILDINNGKRVSPKDNMHNYLLFYWKENVKLRLGQMYMINNCQIQGIHIVHGCLSPKNGLKYKENVFIVINYLNSMIYI